MSQKVEMIVIFYLSVQVIHSVPNIGGREGLQVTATLTYMVPHIELFYSLPIPEIL